MIMTRYEIEQGLDALYRDLDNVQNMDEETARRVYNIDCKADIIEAIQDEIKIYQAILKPDISDRKMNYQRTADEPYLCWSCD